MSYQKPIVSLALADQVHSTFPGPAIPVKIYPKIPNCYYSLPIISGLPVPHTRGLPWRRLLCRIQGIPSSCANWLTDPGSHLQGSTGAERPSYGRTRGVGQREALRESTRWIYH